MTKLTCKISVPRWRFAMAMVAAMIAGLVPARRRESALQAICEWYARGARIQAKSPFISRELWESCEEKRT